MKLSAGGPYGNPFLLPAGTATLSGNLVGSLIPFGTRFRVELYDQVADGPDNTAEQTVTGLTLTTTAGTLPSPPAGAIAIGPLVPNGGPTVVSSSFGVGQVRWFKFTLGTAAALSDRFLDIDTETTTGLSDTEIALFGADGKLIATDDDDGSANLSQLSFGIGIASRSSVGDGLSYDNRDGFLFAGDYYIAVAGFNATFNDGFGATTNATNTGNCNLRMRYGGFPEGAENLLTISPPATKRFVGQHVSGQVRWYRFSLLVATGPSSFVDIDTLGTVGFTGGDTEIALYSSTGALLATDDDSSVGNLSLLTFGPSAGNRGIQGAIGSDPYDGVNGELSAGSYLLAVGGFDTVFSPAFQVTSTSPNADPIQVNVRRGPLAVLTVFGTVALGDSDGDLSNEVIDIDVYQGSTFVARARATLGANGAYSVPLYGVPPGTYDFYYKGDTFLRSSFPGVTIFGSTINVNMTLTNGDVNGDNEVGAADFSQLAAAYDAVLGDSNYDANADLNDDDEVGAADFSILAAQYDEVGDSLP